VRTKVTLTGKSVFKRLADAVQAEARVTVTAMATQQVKNIKQRTQWTAGADDSPMPALSSSYAKRKRGRKIRNLRQSGQMMRDLKAFVAKKSGAGWEGWVQFKDQRSARIAAWNQARAKWFAFSPNDTRVLMRKMEGFAARVKARLSGGGA